MMRKYGTARILGDNEILGVYEEKNQEVRPAMVKQAVELVSIDAWSSRREASLVSGSRPMEEVWMTD